MSSRALLLVLLVALPAVSGCLGGSDDDADDVAPRPGAAGLRCFPASEVPAAPSDRGASGEMACNFPATVTPESRQANELSIAVNPLDPLNLIATGKDYTPEYAGECVWDGIYTTHDGGKTWRNANIPGSNWRRASDPTEPVTNFSKFWCATDPVVQFGPDGTAYWTVMPYQCDRVTGSKTGRETHERGGFNDWFWSCSSMYVLVSEDGGDTWPIAREVAFGPRLEHDKQWISVGPDGDVVLCWDRSAVGWTDIYSGVAPEPVPDLPPWPGQLPRGLPEEVSKYEMLCAVSTDKGRSWSEPTSVNRDRWDGYLPSLDHGPDGRAWMVFINGTHVFVSSSDDGLDWGERVPVGTYELPPPGGEYGWPVLNGSDFRTLNIPHIAVDRTNGPYSGSIYVIWFDHSAGDGEAMLVYSRDGVAWSDPKRVSDDAPEDSVDQFYPAASVGPDGTLDLAWWDRRDDPDNHLFDLYYTYSLDGGETLAQNLRVSEVSSDERYSHHQNGMVFLGDYIDLASSEGVAHPIWVDTRQGSAEAYVAHVERPGANR